MASVTAEKQAPSGFGATARRDAWWAGPAATLLGLLAFVVYSTWAGMQGNYFEIRSGVPDFTGAATHPYLSPFYSPLIYDTQSHHAWIRLPEGQTSPSWWPTFMPFSAAMLILAGPGLFRLTCYYYRKAYYRAFWADPPACAVGEPRKSYWGENHWPLLLQNAHRYTLYVAVLFLVVLWWDALYAFWWPTNRFGAVDAKHHFGMGTGTIIMLINVILLTGFTFGCNSMRHLTGGRLNRFACFDCAYGQVPSAGKTRIAYRTWRISSWFNDRHALWAWLSLFSVGFTDFYIRLCAMGKLTDVRYF
jgi:hypothetical protein